MSNPPRRRPPTVLESALVVSRSWTGAALIAVLAVAGTGSCRPEAPPLADAALASPGEHRDSPRATHAPR